MILSVIGQCTSRQGQDIQDLLQKYAPALFAPHQLMKNLPVLQEQDPAAVAGRKSIVSHHQDRRLHPAVQIRKRLQKDLCQPGIQRPVGSSAKTISGLVIKARHTAARCLCAATVNTPLPISWKMHLLPGTTRQKSAAWSLTAMVSLPKAAPADIRDAPMSTGSPAQHQL